eukprot:15448553-Alexandrium_andersonii.AAC.1
MLSHSNFGRRFAAPKVALPERPRPMVRRPSGGGPERALKGLCGGELASPLGRLGHRQAAGAPT